MDDIKDIVESISIKSDSALKEKVYTDWQKIEQIAKKLPQVKRELKNEIFEDYMIAMYLQRSLDKYFGNLPRTIYIVKTSEDNLTLKGTYEISLEEYIGKHFGIKIDYSNKISKEKQEKMNLERKKHLTMVKSAYEGTAARLNRFFEIAGVTSLKYSKKKGFESDKGTKQGGLLMWKEQKDWVLATVDNYGDVKEAYVAALMQEHKSKLDLCTNVKGIGNPKYYSHKLISNFFDSYISKVDNLGPVYGEDVQLNDKQIGVKAQNSSLWGLEQYRELAKKIIAQNGEPPTSYWDLFETANPEQRNKRLETYLQHNDYLYKFINDSLETEATERTSQLAHFFVQKINNSLGNIKIF